jgi:DNA invertase Pin-like site-specific DNA recombinase
MNEAGRQSPIPDTPVYGYATVTGRVGDIINRELREQAEEIATECDRLDLRLLQVITEREPARRKDMNRPGLEYALTRIRAGEATGLVVRNLSRLTRSPAHLSAILEWFLRHRLRLVSIAEQVDTLDLAGRVAVRTLIGFSNRERQRITEATRRGLETARQDAGPRRRAAVYDDPELRARIQHMRDREMSLQEIADTLNAEGVPTVRGGAKWRPSSLQAVTGYRRKKPELASLLSGDAP